MKRKELLVCRRAKEPAKGTLDLPGGFIDMNETGEEGVSREVWEETGLKVEKSDLSVLPAEHLYLFRLSRSYARYVLSLYRKRHEPFLGNG